MSDGTKAVRKKHVQTLRGLARVVGVDAVRDDARRDVVEPWAVQLTENTQMTSAQRQAARDTLASYRATFLAVPEDLGPPAPPAEAVGELRVRGRSFLLTYNWDYLGTPFPDGTQPAECHADLWRIWRAWKQQKKADMRVTQSTSTLEASLNSQQEGRVHLHWKINLERAIDTLGTAIFAFHGVRPDVRATTIAGMLKGARGASYVEASNRAHFYAWAPKRGTIYRGTNWQPFHDYRVMGRWLDDLWTDGKLDHDVYGELALKVRLGYEGRKRNLEAVKAAERESQVDVEIQTAAHELARLKAPPREFPEVRTWEDSFLQLRFRWKLLVLVADSASGKSTFAEGLFRNPYVLTVEDAEDLDLRGFDRGVHDGIVLDNVNTWQQLLGWRAVLQARNAKSRGGQSKTNVYSYVQYLFGVAVVATVDLDAPDAYLVSEEQPQCSRWLIKNCVFVRLHAGETFFDQSRLPALQIDNTYSLFAETVKRRRLQQPN